LTFWFALTGLAGFAFGVTSDRRLFGDGVLAHPLIVFGIICGLGLFAIRIVLRRPVPELLPERIVLLGFALGIVLFVAGQFLAPFLMSY